MNELTKTILWFKIIARYLIMDYEDTNTVYWPVYIQADEDGDKIWEEKKTCILIMGTPTAEVEEAEEEGVLEQLKLYWQLCWQLQ